MKLVGRQFGKWLVLSKGPSDKYWNRRWLCRCECGKERLVLQNSLVYGKSSMCHPCAMRASAEKRAQAIKTHGLSRSLEYKVWSEMIRRCHNHHDTSYANYGGRGIQVCDDWRGAGGFEAFIGHIGRRPSASHAVDRIDNNGNYEPGNVRWATQTVQGRNTRKNRLITAFGKTMTLAEWAERTGIKRETIARRLNCGWSSERALNTPPRRS
jgi:hypothetical protein